MTKTLALLGTLFLTASSQSWASDAKPQHGGRVTEAGEYHVEMVAKADAIQVYLADHDNKAVKATGHKGVAILMVDGKSQRIVLEPAGDAMLSGKATGTLPAAPKGVVQITPPKGKTVQARFN
jgi:hypothetical protein